MSVSLFRGRIPWRFSLSKNNISPAAPDLELILSPLWYWPIMNAHTKQQQDKLFETRFYWQSKVRPPIYIPFGTMVTWWYWHSGRFLVGLFTFLSRQPIQAIRVSSTSSELVEWTGSKLSSWLEKQKTKQKSKFSVFSWHYGFMLSCKMWSVPHMCTNEWLETSDAIGNWFRQWITKLVPLTSFDVTHPGRSGSCQTWYINMFWQPDLTPWCLRDGDWARERLLKIKCSPLSSN